MNTLEILEKVKNNEIDINKAETLLNDTLDYATIDYDRKRRTGAGEVIYGQSKTVEQLQGIIFNMLEHHQKSILATRISLEKYEVLKEVFPDFNYDELSQVFYYQGEEVKYNKGKIAVVCAGTSDLPVANEAAITARFLGNEVIQVTDVGVAGLHRLLKRMDDIEQANVIIVVAGMEGALASVIGGLVDKPVIAVPTSVGYGANFQGLSALLSMLNSCASGVSVVNIDNGFGAGYMAHTINCLGGKR
ncbi:MAG: nickel pincer cofactor biosynthesis protein LarB [Erysipelotrichaceae bacterium]|nr:nickel pincer cofactor biosynthesis protein LarB [Erysipelotrichaceae bacterium]